MQFEWDEKKRQRNLTEHSVDFTAIAGFDWASAITAVDDRVNYGEERFIAHGLVNRRLHVCVYTQRGAVRRIISLRKANKREERFYENQAIDE